VAVLAAGRVIRLVLLAVPPSISLLVTTWALSLPSKVVVPVGKETVPELAKEAAVAPVRVLVEDARFLLVRDWLLSIPTRVVDASGNWIVRAIVLVDSIVVRTSPAPPGLNLICLVLAEFTISLLLPTMFLFCKVSVPVRVARVPEEGRVTVPPLLRVDAVAPEILLVEPKVLFVSV
jgi:hypothetical protein